MTQSISNKNTKRLLDRIQRHLALRIYSAYKTVSNEAALVIAGIPPIKIMAKERNEIYRGRDRTTTKEELWQNWQQEWETTEKGTWTRRLIPNVRQWVDRKHGEVNYYLTQALSGHGSFGDFLYMINKANTEECIYCGENDSAEHTIFWCRRWTEERADWKRQLEENITPKILVEQMMDTREKWETIERVVTNIMK